MKAFQANLKIFTANCRHPKIFQPPPSLLLKLFAKVYEEILTENKEIVTIVISEKLSGTYNSAMAAANMTTPDKISVIDSETTVKSENAGYDCQ